MKIVAKPWGKETWFAQAPNYVGKFLFIKKGHRLSKQYHKVKHETIYTLKGRFLLEIGTLSRTRRKVMAQGSVVELKPGVVHRFEAPFGDVTLVEVSTPQVWDVVRLEDDYGRNDSKKQVKKSAPREGKRHG